jgi:hypothetical protein
MSRVLMNELSKTAGDPSIRHREDESAAETTLPLSALGEEWQ